MSTTAATAATAKRMTVTVTFHAKLMHTPVPPGSRGLQRCFSGRDGTWVPPEAA